MDVTSAYILAKKTVIPSLPIFYLGHFITEDYGGICKVEDLDAYYECEEMGYTIDDYSSYFLTEKPIWFRRSEARLWRINRDHLGSWHLLPFNYGDKGKMEQVSGEAISMTAFLQNNPVAVAVSRNGQGEWKRGTDVVTHYGSTYVYFKGVGSEGYYNTFEISVISEALINLNAFYNPEDIPLERGGLLNFALNDYFGTPDTCLIKYGNRGTVTAEAYKSFMYIPTKRTKGYFTLSAKCKVFFEEGEGLDNSVRVGAGAIVDGRMVEVFASTDENTWTDIELDISELPYVDYIILGGNVGALGIKQIVLDQV